ncbi:MAG: NADH-quinone oxidoreductase subunit M [Nitrospinota bacterium]
MEINSTSLLSALILLPIVGSFIILLINSENKDLIKGVAFATTLITFLISIPLFTHFDSNLWEMQFVEKYKWIEQFGANYHVGVDGLSMPLVVMTTFLTFLCIPAAWSAIQKGVKEFMISLLVLETGMIGVFCALDFLLFYIFWEMMLIPMYLMIGVWGGPRRIYATVKFFIYTMAGSALLLIAILYLYFALHDQTGVFTFEISQYYGLGLPHFVQFWLFLGFFLAFAIKVPLFPFHTWLPDAHVEAPTVGSVILAGVLLKMGTYGMLRFSLPLFPEATVDFSPWICTLAVIGIIYGALVAMVQEDIKKLVAYSSVSHMGFVVLGIFAMNQQGIEGGILQMLNHGVSTGALFLLVGIVYERTHTREILDYGGIAKVVPYFTVMFMIVTLSSIGLPGTNGFIGEFLILLGAFKYKPVFAVFAATGVIFAAVYMLWMFQRVMFGEITKPGNKNLKDMNIRELLYILPLIFFVFYIGIFPNVFLSKMDKTVEHLIEQAKVFPTGTEHRAETVKNQAGKEGLVFQRPDIQLTKEM